MKIKIHNSILIYYVKTKTKDGNKRIDGKSIQGFFSCNIIKNDPEKSWIYLRCKCNKESLSLWNDGRLRKSAWTKDGDWCSLEILP